MKELVEYIAKNLVDDPDSVKVEETQEEQGFVNVTLEVNPQDKGKVIGVKVLSRDTDASLAMSLGLGPSTIPSSKRLIDNFCLAIII